ncbi:MAG: DUF348 domain-containing protein [Anaerolineales bacterium]|nr:DUF348 domain-containing protein [Anaerolineales bacterium]
MLANLKEWLGKRKHQFYLLAAVLLLGGIVLVYIATQRQVTILLDGQTIEVHTHANTVANVLRTTHITPHPEDRISPDLDQPLEEDQVIQVRRARPVHFINNGDEEDLWTAEEYVGNILASQGISVFPDDLVWVDGVPLSGERAAGQSVYDRLEIQPAVSINIKIDGDRDRYRLGGHSLAEALWNAGFAVYQADWVNEDLSAPIPELAAVEFRRSFPIQLKIRGQLFNTRVIASTVAEAIERAGAVLIGLDQTRQGEEEPVPSQKPITLTRVVEEVVLEQKPVPFGVVYQADPESLIDTQSLLNAGEYGVEAERIRIRYENGTETSRVVEGSWTAREPEARVVGYGTRIEIKTLNTSDGPIEYWRAIDMYATSYSPSRAGVPDDYPYFGITACGIAAAKGVVAVDRSYIPFYTPLYIPGYGSAIACDTGGAIVGRKIDLGYDDDNWESWHWNVTVYFLTPVPAPENIAWIIP